MFHCGNITVCGKWGPEDGAANDTDLQGSMDAKLLGAQPEGKKGLKTLVISLESLIFNTLQPLEDADFIINVEVDEIVYQVHVKKRPGIEEFLSQVSQDYEVLIWTSRAQYVNSCIDQIDTNKVVSARLFREHCRRETNGDVIKDIGQIGRPIKKIILIDDQEINYLHHPKNSIALHSWRGNDDDQELFEILPLLKDDLKDCKDVRKILDASMAAE